MLGNLQVGLARSQPAFWFALIIMAILAGTVIGHGQWLYVSALALIPLLWFWPIRTAFGMFVLLVPFEGLTKLGGGTTLVLIAGLLAGGTLAAIGILGGRLDRPPRTALWWLLLLFWGIASVLWAVEPLGTLHQLLTAAALIIFYVVAASFRIGKDEFECIVRLTILGGCLAAIFVSYEFYSGIRWAAGARAAMTMGDTQVNPDNLGLRFILPISLAAALFLSARTRLTKLLTLCAFLLTVFGLLLTMSLAGLLALTVLIIVFLRRLRIDRRFVAVALLAAGLLVAMPSTFFKRFGEAQATGGAGRLDIWTAGLGLAEHHPIVGTGLGNFPIVYSQYAGDAPKFRGFNRSPHNVYLLVWAELGIVGFALFAMVVKTQFTVISDSRKRSTGPQMLLVACEAAFSSLLVYGFFTDALWDKTFWLSWIFLAFAITVQKQVDPGHPSRQVQEIAMLRTR